MSILLSFFHYDCDVQEKFKKKEKKKVKQNLAGVQTLCVISNANSKSCPYSYHSRSCITYNAILLSFCREDCTAQEKLEVMVMQHFLRG